MENLIHCWGCGKEIHATVATCPHCGADQNRSKAGKPWGTGRMVFYSIFSLLIPIAGLGAGIQGLLSSGKRKQGALLLILGIIGALIYVAIAMKPRYVQPDERFLQSELMVRPGISEVGLSVSQFVEILQKVVMDNGKNPQVKGWIKNDNIYTLHVEMKRPVELRFTHVLAPPADGKISVLGPVDGDAGPISAMQFLLTVLAMVPEHPKSPPPNTTTAAPAPPAETPAADRGQSSDLPSIRNESYASAREKMIAAGWQPFHASNADPCENDDPRCKDRPEMEACSGTGAANCRFLWKKGEKIVGICTVGEEASSSDYCGN